MTVPPLQPALPVAHSISCCSEKLMSLPVAILDLASKAPMEAKAQHALHCRLNQVKSRARQVSRGVLLARRAGRPGEGRLAAHRALVLDGGGHALGRPVQGGHVGGLEGHELAVGWRLKNFHGASRRHVARVEPEILLGELGKAQVRVLVRRSPKAVARVVDVHNVLHVGLELRQALVVLHIGGVPPVSAQALAAWQRLWRPALPVPALCNHLVDAAVFLAMEALPLVEEGLEGSIALQGGDTRSLCGNGCNSNTSVSDAARLSAGQLTLAFSRVFSAPLAACAPSRVFHIPVSGGIGVGEAVVDTDAAVAMAVMEVGATWVISRRRRPPALALALSCTHNDSSTGQSAVGTRSACCPRQRRIANGSCSWLCRVLHLQAGAAEGQGHSHAGHDLHCLVRPVDCTWEHRSRMGQVHSLHKGKWQLGGLQEAN